MSHNKLYKIPIIIVHGTLGSGKTTLVRNLLSLPQFKQSIVIENEFASENIDRLILEQDKSHQTFEISGQCICCSSGQELEKALEIIAKDFPNKTVILETTGVANSVQLIQKLFLNSDFLDYFQILKNILVIDPLETTIRMITKQKVEIKLSDIIIINKTDLIDIKKIKDLSETINKLSPKAKVLSTNNAAISIKQLDLTTTSQIEDAFVDHYEELVTDNQTHSLPSYVIFKSELPVPSQKIEKVVEKLQKHKEIGLKRIKGYIFDGSSGWILQGTSHHIEKNKVAPINLKSSSVVFIGENVNQSTIADFKRYLYD